MVELQKQQELVEKQNSYKKIQKWERLMEMKKEAEAKIKKTVNF